MLLSIRIMCEWSITHAVRMWAASEHFIIRLSKWIVNNSRLNFSEVCCTIFEINNRNKFNCSSCFNSLIKLAIFWNFVWNVYVLSRILSWVLLNNLFCVSFSLHFSWTFYHFNEKKTPYIHLHPISPIDLIFNWIYSTTHFVQGFDISASRAVSRA